MPRNSGRQVLLAKKDDNVFVFTYCHISSGNFLWCCCRQPQQQRWFAQQSRLKRQLLEQFTEQRNQWLEPELQQWQQQHEQQQQGQRVLPALPQRL